MKSKLTLAVAVAAMLLSGFWYGQSKASSNSAGSYEYQVLLDAPMNVNVKALNEYGAQGWELVGVAPDEKNGTIILYLKRTRK